MSETDQPAPKRKRDYSTRGGVHQPLRDPPAAAAARAIYEGLPGATCGAVAAKMGIPAGIVRRWKSEASGAGAPWKSSARTVGNLTGLAGELANSFKTKMSELGKPMDDAVAAREAEKEVATTFAVDLRAQVLDRHRKEWNPVRALAYDCIKKGSEGKVAEAYEKGKLAKIMSETLQIIQNGECRAFGLDNAARGADERRTLVTIEREDSEPVEEQHNAPALPSTGSDVDTF